MLRSRCRLAKLFFSALRFRSEFAPSHLAAGHYLLPQLSLLQNSDIEPNGPTLTQLGSSSASRQLRLKLMRRLALSIRDARLHRRHEVAVVLSAFRSRKSVCRNDAEALAE